MHKCLLLINGCLFLLLTSCAPKPFIPSTGHVQNNTSSAQDTGVTGDIPEVVRKVPNLPIPSTTDLDLEEFSVVVNELPVKEILVAIADESKFNIDVDPAITGLVTLNVIEQNITQILDRIARQVDIRYEFLAENLYIYPDTPFFKTYIIDYVNLSRDVSSKSSVSTQISATSGGGDSLTGSGSSGGGGNNSTTDVSTKSTHHFWNRLVSNIAALLDEVVSSGSGQELPVSASVISNPEAGVLLVRATEAKHKQIGSFIEILLERAKRQVLIQATIVEVRLNKNYQAGIDWTFLDEEGRLGVNLISNTLTATALGNNVSSSFEITSTNNDQSVGTITREGNLIATVRLLDEFGDARILSSPQIMVLNNQTALLKVVENVVYFEVDSEATVGQSSDVVLISTDTEARTVPVGLVMALTPQIDTSGRGVVTLNVRPTISSLGTPVADPNPALTIPNQVPTIRVREMESVLRLVDGQIGVLGGLMTDEVSNREAGLPGVKNIDFFGNLFKSKSAQYTKTELVIFLKPIIINSPDINSDLSDYQKYLEVYGEGGLIEGSEIQ